MKGIGAKIIATFVVLIVPLSFFFYFAVIRKPVVPKPLPVIGEVGWFKFADQMGDSISVDDLKGYVWVADFYFGKCNGICPRMNKKLGEILEKTDADDPSYSLKSEKRFKLISFSVDPENDSVPALKKYADDLKADPNKWFFLTGDKKQMIHVVNDYFKLGLTYESNGEEAITHSDRWVLVDGEGKYRAFYKPLDETDGEKEFERMMTDIQVLLQEEKK